MRKDIAAVLILTSLFLGSRKGSAFLLDMDCGRSNRTRLTPNIYSGNRTDILANPWMVSVIVKGEAKCSGSLINHRFVLTAAHCVFKEQMQVHLGEFNAMNPGDCGADARIPNAYCVRVDKKIIHAQFSQTQTQQYDIGLLRMQHAVLYSDTVRPICLVINESVVAIDRFQITGWGTTEEGNPIFPRVLKNTFVERIDRGRCSSKFQEQVDKSQICTGSGTSDACRGDSGGPMSAEVLYRGRYRTIQLGIISFGLSSCAGLSVCTKVAHYTDWMWDALNSSSA